MKIIKFPGLSDADKEQVIEQIRKSHKFVAISEDLETGQLREHRFNADEKDAIFMFQSGIFECMEDLRGDNA